MMKPLTLILQSNFLSLSVNKINLENAFIKENTPKPLPCPNSVLIIYSLFSVTIYSLIVLYFGPDNLRAYAIFEKRAVFNNCDVFICTSFCFSSIYSLFIVCIDSLLYYYASLISYSVC